MSTFLELVNQTREECGASGPALTSLGGTLSLGTQRIKNWVKSAWLEIQRAHRTWNFMLNTFTFTTTAGVQSYTASALSPTPLTDFANWKVDAMRCYRTSLGIGDEQVLPFMDWLTFRDVYQFGTNGLTQARPVAFTIDPQKKLLLGQIPDESYTITGWYYRAPQTLSADSDTPSYIPAEFHEAVVFKAMVKYGMYEAAAETMARGREEGDRVMAALESDYLPAVTMGPSLA
jgi:hypothetical protein